MARSRQEIELILKQKLIRKQIESFSFDDLITVMSNASQAQKNRFIEAVKKNEGRTVSNMLYEIIKIRSEQLATEEVQTILADNNLSLTEIDRLL